jgi:diguanylate cyclase (GGDEF)-like protein/PAS domain S-box-containing protein
MAKPRIKTFWREAIVVYTSAALVVLGTLVATRYLVVRKFASIEHAEVTRSLEVLRQSFVAHNTEIEVVSRDYARWDDMYAYVSSLDPTFESENFSQPGLDEMNVELVWLLDTNDRLISSFDNDTASDRYAHPARTHIAAEIAALTPLIKRIRDQEGGLRLGLIAGAPHVLVAQTILHSDRSGPAAGTLVFARAIATEEMARVREDAQAAAEFVLANSPIGVGRLNAELRDSGQHARAIRAVSPSRIDGHLRLDGIDGLPIAVLSAKFERAIMQGGLRSANYLVMVIALLVVAALAGWHIYSNRLRRSSAAAHASQARYRAVFERTPAGVILFNKESQVILDANPAAQRMMGAPSALLQQHRIGSLFNDDVRLDVETDPAIPRANQPTTTLERSDGSVVDLEFAVVAIEPRHDNVAALILRDVSHRREAERRATEHQRSLQHQAMHDSLTGLPNRLHLNEQLPLLMREAERRGGSIAVFYIDCDHFKNINDSRGHTVGDEYLRCVAHRLRGALASSDLVARMGGDEFLVVTRHESLEPNAQAIAERISQSLKQPIQLGDAAYSATCSIGVATFPQDASSMTELLRAADIALYEAKGRGRDSIQAFDAAMNQRVQERLGLEQDLRKAVEADAIDIHLQPIVDIRSNQIVSFEALARWHHPLHGAVPPLAFIKVAEQSDLIVALGECVLRRVARLMREWIDAGIEPVPVAVNVSAKQLQRSDLASKISEITAQFGVMPQLIGIELTESVAMHDSAEHIAKLHALRDLGMRVSVDDFGTGYSSLSYLRNLPIDYLKIDRSFVRDMNVDGNDAAIVRAIISMASSLRLGTVAEGVETLEQASQLVALGCAIGQGYHFARPLAAEATIELLRSAQTANTAPNRPLALTAISA